jgi:hypothetical protein
VLAERERAHRSLLAKNAELSAAFGRERQANNALAEANRSERARFDLALDAIKTFHTGVSEDFLLKQEAFGALRGRLLRTARQFYAKLEAGLRDRTDPRSRSALGDAYFALGRISSLVDSQKEALASYGRALAVDQALADSEPNDPRHRHAVARDRHAVGVVRLATAGSCGSPPASCPRRRSRSRRRGPGSSA